MVSRENTLSEIIDAATFTGDGATGIAAPCRLGIVPVEMAAGECHCLFIIKDEGSGGTPLTGLMVAGEGAVCEGSGAVFDSQALRRVVLKGAVGKSSVGLGRVHFEAGALFAAIAREGATRSSDRALLQVNATADIGAVAVIPERTVDKIDCCVAIVQVDGAIGRIGRCCRIFEDDVIYIKHAGPHIEHAAGCGAGYFTGEYCSSFSGNGEAVIGVESIVAADNQRRCACERIRSGGKMVGNSKEGLSLGNVGIGIIARRPFDAGLPPIETHGILCREPALRARTADAYVHVSGIGIKIAEVLDMVAGEGDGLVIIIRRERRVVVTILSIIGDAESAVVDSGSYCHIIGAGGIDVEGDASATTAYFADGDGIARETYVDISGKMGAVVIGRFHDDALYGRVGYRKLQECADVLECGGVRAAVYLGGREIAVRERTVLRRGDGYGDGFAGKGSDGRRIDGIQVAAFGDYGGECGGGSAGGRRCGIISSGIEE